MPTVAPEYGLRTVIDCGAGYLVAHSTHGDGPASAGDGMKERFAAPV